MTKVWVPIDLPGGAKVEYVTCSDANGPRGWHYLLPWGPIFPMTAPIEPIEPKSETPDHADPYAVETRIRGILQRALESLREPAIVPKEYIAKIRAAHAAERVDEFVDSLRFAPDECESHTARNRPNADPSHAPRWEYLSVSNPEGLDMETYGKSGWECFAVTTPAGENPVFYFKRRLASVWQ